MEIGGLSRDEPSNKVVIFVIDDASIFQGICIGVNVQLTNKDNPFVIGIHYMSHCTNLAMQTLLKLVIMQKMKGLL
jgi:hypothetical protein